MPSVNRPHDDRPQEKTGSKMYRPPGSASQNDNPNPIARKIRVERHIPIPNSGRVAATCNNVAHQVTDITIVRGRRAQVPVVHEHPTHVGPIPADVWCVRIGLVVGMLVMDTMDEHPARW